MLQRGAPLFAPSATVVIPKDSRLSPFIHAWWISGKLNCCLLRRAGELIRRTDDGADSEECPRFLVRFLTIAASSRNRNTNDIVAGCRVF